MEGSETTGSTLPIRFHAVRIVLFQQPQMSSWQVAQLTRLWPPPKDEYSLYRENNHFIPSHYTT